MKIFKSGVSFKSKHIDMSDGALIIVSKYSDGSDALMAQSWGGRISGTTTVSTNLADYGMNSGGGLFFIKNYGDHEGLAEALEAAGVITIDHEVRIGWGSGYAVRLIGWDAWAEKHRA